MKSMGLMNLAALVAAGTILALGFVVFPERLASNVVIVSLVIFSASVGFMFYIPSVLAKTASGGTDAAQMASLGPSAFLSLALFLLTLIGVFFALAEFERLAIAVDVLAIGGFIVALIIVRASLGVVNEISSRAAAPSRHGIWQSELRSLAIVSRDAPVRSELERLAEKFRYSASDAGEDQSDHSISQAIGDVTKLISAGDSAGAQEKLSEINLLADQREVRLRSRRSKV